MASDDHTGSVVSLAERRAQLEKAKADKAKREAQEKMTLREVVDASIDARLDQLRDEQEEMLDQVVDRVVAFKDDEAERKVQEAIEAEKREAEKRERVRRAMREARRMGRLLNPPTTPPSGPRMYPGQWQPVEAKENKPTLLWWCGVVGAVALGTYGVCKGIGYVMARNAAREEEADQLRAYKRAMLEAESNPTVHNTYVQHGLGKAEVQDIVIDSLREHGLSRAEARALAEQGLADVVDAKVAASADDLRLHLDNRFSRAQDRTARSIVDTVNEFASQLKPQHHHHETTKHVPNTYDDSGIRGEIEGIRQEFRALKRERMAAPPAVTRHVESSYDDSWARREISNLKRRPRETVIEKRVESSYDDSWARREISNLKRRPREKVIEKHHHHTTKQVVGEDQVARKQIQKMQRELAKVKKQKPKVIKETVNVTEVHEHHHHTARLVKAPRQSKAKAKPKTNAKLFDTDIG